MATATKKPRKPRQSKVDPNESKADKFKRLGTARYTKCVTALRNLAKLGGAGYERTAEQQKKITEGLRAEVAAVEKALVPHVPGTKAEKVAPSITL